MGTELALFIVFVICVFTFLIIDLGIFQTKAHKISFKTALFRTILLFFAAVIFAVLIYMFDSKAKAFEFMSAYLTEEALSIDNLFVILLIFKFFKLDKKYYHRVLFWGILGAMIFRAIFIGLGTVILSHFHFALYVLGGILIYTSIKLFLSKGKDEKQNFNESKSLNLLEQYLPISKGEHHGKFIHRANGKFTFTTLFLTLCMIEITDILFAIDSIPAVLSISQDIFVVFTSNIFAILGLRSLFFLFEGLVSKLKYLQTGLAFILLFIGIKMVVRIFAIDITSSVSFLVIFSTLLLSVIASLIAEKNKALMKGF